jgi:hypothetical protein
VSLQAGRAICSPDIEQPEESACARHDRDDRHRHDSPPSAAVRPHGDTRGDGLTAREFEVLASVARGYSNTRTALPNTSRLKQ